MAAVLIPRLTRWRLAEVQLDGMLYQRVVHVGSNKATTMVHGTLAMPPARHDFSLVAPAWQTLVTAAATGELSATLSCQGSKQHQLAFEAIAACGLTPTKASQHMHNPQPPCLDPPGSLYVEHYTATVHNDQPCRLAGCVSLTAKGQTTHHQRTLPSSCAPHLPHDNSGSSPQPTHSRHKAINKRSSSSSSSSSRRLLLVTTCAWCCCMMLRACASQPAPSTAAAGTSRPPAGPSCCTWTRMAAGTWAAAAAWAASHALQRHQVRKHTVPEGSCCRPTQQQQQGAS